MEGIQYGIQQGYNPMTTAAYAAQPYASQPFASQPYNSQQSLFGGPATPLGGLLGSGIAGLMSGQNVGRQPGQVIDGLSHVDPITAHIQQAQLAHQIQLAQQAQLAQQQAQLGQLIQQAQLAQQLAQQQTQGRWSPFGMQFNPLNRIDPVTAAYIQQAQVAQLCQQLALQSQIGQQGQFGPSHFGQGQFGQGQFGQGQFGQGQFGQTQPFYGQQTFGPPSSQPLGSQGWQNGGLNPWANLAFAAPFGRGGQLPIY